MYLEALKLNQRKIFEKLMILKLIEFKNVKLSQVSEIAVMKAYTLNYRGTYKDYLDLYFILKNEYTTLKEIKKIAEKKYKNDFNFRLFLEQLIYLGDIVPEKIEFLKKRVGRSEIESFFKKIVKEIKI